MEKQLSKGQVHILMILNQQKNELQKQFQELVEFENEQIEMIANYYNFPQNEKCQLRQNGMDIFIYTEENKEKIENEE